jgi:glucose dehydrogenase
VGWASYGGDKASAKYSTLAQIDRDNFNRLRVAWTWRSAEADVVKSNLALRTWAWESTSLMVDGVLYVSTSLSQVAALDAATGKTKWVYDPETWKNGTPSNNGFVHRGGRLLGGWERSTHSLRNRRRLSDLPERADRQAPFPHSVRTGVSI